MRWRTTASVLGALVALGVALALDYRVDPSGGPLDLAERVAAAFDAWREAGAEEDVAEEEDAATLFAYGDPALFGPDTVSLTLRRGGGEDAATVEVLLDPGRQGRLPRVLLHETGVLLGLAPATVGVMRPALTDADPSAPSEDDVAALRDASTFAREDLNRNGVVDFYDLALLAEAFGTTGVSLPADIDDNGAVDDEDLALLREAYVFGPPSETPPAGFEPDPGDEEVGVDEISEDPLLDEDPLEEPTDTSSFEEAPSEDAPSEEDAPDADPDPESDPESDPDPAGNAEEPAGS